MVPGAAKEFGTRRRPIYQHPTLGIFSGAAVGPTRPRASPTEHVCGGRSALMHLPDTRALATRRPHVHRTEPTPRCSSPAGSPRTPVPSACTKGPACTNAGPLVFSCAGALRTRKHDARLGSGRSPGAAANDRNHTRSRRDEGSLRYGAPCARRSNRLECTAFSVATHLLEVSPLGLRAGSCPRPRGFRVRS
jgi:hypothetical protein